MNIVCIGSGNIATHLSKAFFSLGHHISQIYSHTSANAKALAEVVMADSFTDNIHDLLVSADLYIIAVSDKALQQIVENLPNKLQGLVVHTSGATDINVLDKFENYGVIYPPQSINKNIETDLAKIPFCIEANSEKNLDRLLGIMEEISSHNLPCSSHQRLALHISAVLVNNFTNSLYQIAYDILAEQNLSFDLLKPIISETAEKIKNHIPKDVQTGPAIRNDQITINKHLQFLSNSKDISKIYQDLTEFIIKRSHK